MTTWILNSAVLPAGRYGTYRFAAATWDEIRNALTSANHIVSRVGYQETLDMIERHTGVWLPLSREPSLMAPGDVAYVVRLRYRVDPTRKGVPTGADDSAWEVARLEYLG